MARELLITASPKLMITRLSQTSIGTIRCNFFSLVDNWFRFEAFAPMYSLRKNKKVVEQSQEESTGYPKVLVQEIYQYDSVIQNIAKLGTSE